MTSWLRLIWSRLRSLLTKDRLEREFDAALRTHLIRCAIRTADERARE